MAPRISGGTTARNGPRLRIRSRNQRGPSYTCRDMVESAMRRGYGEPSAGPRHPRGRPRRPTGTATVVGTALAVAIAVATRLWYAPIAAGAVAAVVRSPRLGIAVAA